MKKSFQAWTPLRTEPYSRVRIPLGISTMRTAHKHVLHVARMVNAIISD
jgi:hypothetical protein